MCGLVGVVEDEKLLSLEPDHAHPVSQGFACTKGIRFGEVHHHPARVKKPHYLFAGLIFLVGIVGPYLVAMTVAGLILQRAR